jgi:hypothetical protein
MDTGRSISFTSSGKRTIDCSIILCTCLGGEDEASEFEVAYLQLVKDALAQGADIGLGEILFL